MTQSSPGLTKALEFVESGVEQGRFGEEEFLPPVSRLAAECGVSYVTMWKAIGVLKRDGILSGPPGHRVRLASPPSIEETVNHRSSVPARPASSLPKWRQVALDIERDILNGVYQRGVGLPILKELQSRYGTTARTLRKSLNHLCTRGRVVPYGRSYRVPSLVTSGSRITVALLVYTRGGYMVMSPFGHSFFQALEQRCARARIGLVVVNVAGDGDNYECYERDSGRRISARDIRQLDGCLYMVSVPSTVHLPLLRALARGPNPVAILDEIGLVFTSPSLPANRRVKVFRVGDSEKPGEHVARFLLELGHRSVAFFSPFHREAWSQRRYDGMVDVFETAGHGSSLRLFAVNRRIHDRRYLEEGIRRCDLTTFLDYYHRNVHPALQSNVARFIIGRRHWEELCEYAEVQYRLDRLFKRALAEKGITAWVTVNDELAAAFALEFLGKHGITPPHTLSLIGFDDSPAALRKGVTTYNFNPPAYTTAMLEHLLHPFSARGKAIVELQGTIIRRRTTGPVGGA